VSQEIVERLASIEGKVDQLLDIKKDHETRLRSLEGWKWWVSGGLAALTFVLNKVWR
jgi:hypothetical protein